MLDQFDITAGGCASSQLCESRAMPMIKAKRRRQTDADRGYQQRVEETDPASATKLDVLGEYSINDWLMSQISRVIPEAEAWDDVGTVKICNYVVSHAEASATIAAPIAICSPVPSRRGERGRSRYAGRLAAGLGRSLPSGGTTRTVRCEQISYREPAAAALAPERVEAADDFQRRAWLRSRSKTSA